MSNGKIGGLVVIAAAVFLIVMGIKGSQHALFPQLFGTSAETGVNASTGAVFYAPAHAGNCPKGMVYLNAIKMCSYTVA